ncbi:MAG: AAA family ATPase [Acidithiobacillus sp.]|jgi:predicted kinase|uniref:AAA family ATPase n=1 Tax=Acidithiobacillus sp. TaxID=1872118 RepID=UPI0035608ADE
MKKKNPIFFMPIGIPSSGKSTIRTQILKKYPKLCVISPDEIRFQLLDYEHTKKDFDPEIEPQVWAKAKLQLNQCIENTQDIFFDATNVDKKGRTDLLHQLSPNYIKKAIYIQIEPELAILRQKKRERQVPEKIIYDKYNNLQLPTLDEFDSIDIVSQQASKQECEDLNIQFKEKLTSIFDDKKKQCKICKDI